MDINIIRDKYITLLKKSLLNAFYPENELRIQHLQNAAQKFGRHKPDYNFLHHIEKHLPDELESIKQSRLEGKFIDEGLKNLVFSDTMIGRKRMENLEFCMKEVIQNNIPGDVIECGVWRGGATIFMKGILDAFGVSNKKIWVADSFDGLPKPTHPKSKADVNKSIVPSLAIELETVMENFRKYDLLDDSVQFVKGWFKDTLHTLPAKEFSVLRLDGDLYESTMDALHALYHKLSIGGYIIIDDYGALMECKQAVDDFRSEHNINEAIQTIDWTGVFWQKQN